MWEITSFISFVISFFSKYIFDESKYLTLGFINKDGNLYRLHLNYKNAKIKISRINKESGSSYDIYETMADLELEDEVEVKSLDNLSIPKYYKTIIPIKNNILEYDVDLDPLEVKLIEIVLLN